MRRSNTSYQWAWLRPTAMAARKASLCPGPRSGFFLMMPKADVIELDMSVDEALKYIISMGVVAPNGNGRKKGKPLPRPEIGVLSDDAESRRDRTRHERR